MDRFKRNIDNYCVGEIKLPEIETAVLFKCSNLNCQGEWQLTSQEILLKMRRRPKRDSEELEALFCSECGIQTTCTDRINTALEHGYLRCYQRPRPTKEEVLNLIWLGLPKQPKSSNELEMDRWLLDVAVVHGLLNIHDWRHRASCFKNEREACRYHTPHASVKETCITPQLNDDESKIEQINIEIRRRAIFMFLTDCNLPLLAVLNCNNCTRYVLNQKVSLYYGCYASKHTDENEKALAELMRALNAYEAKLKAEQQQNLQSAMELEKDDLQPFSTTATRSDSSIGLGRLLSGARAATNGETVGAPLAAFVARGNKIFQMSHQTSVVLVTQALAYLKGLELNASFNKKGVVMASTHDYVYRSVDDVLINAMTMWEFVATQEICDLKTSHDKPSDDEEDTDGSSNGPEIIELDIRRSRPIHFFQEGHPLYETKGHRQRTRRTWPKYSAKRLPDLIDLQDDSDLTVEDRNERRELYGQGVLIMFHPFRKITDLKEEDENWWTAFLKRKIFIESNSTSLSTLKSIQNFYESFFRAGTQQEEQNLTFDDPHQLTNIEENKDEETEALDLLDDDQKLHQSSVMDDFRRCTDDPFVKKLISLNDNPLQINQTQSEKIVSIEDAIKAIKELPRSGRPFQLPNRAKLGDFISDDTSSADSLNKTVLDQPIGTRIDLLIHLERALSNTTHTVTTCDGSQPDILEADFPTLDQQSKHWTLNAKQHQAFLLAGTFTNFLFFINC